MTPSIHPKLLIFRAYGPETAEHWLMPGNMPQSSATARLEVAFRYLETRVTGLSCEMPGTSGLIKRVFRVVPSGPDQTQNA